MTAAKRPNRSSVNNAHAYLGAPLRHLRDGRRAPAVAMGSLSQAGASSGVSGIGRFDQEKSAFAKRDEIKAALALHLSQRSTEHWLQRLRAVDYWCAPVLHWHELLEHEAFRCLDMLQTVRRDHGGEIRTTRCRFVLTEFARSLQEQAPRVGEHNDWVNRTFLGETI